MPLLCLDVFQLRALCLAENCTANLHNLYTLRGAQVRDALGWSKYIQECIEQYLEEIDVSFASHHWPRWGRDDIRVYLENQRDLYRCIHDQTMRLANKGYVPTEIAAELRLPDEFLAQGHTRGYYGDLVHNCKAVYQRYLSWYDGNPSNLNKLAPADAGSQSAVLRALAKAEQAAARARAADCAAVTRWQFARELSLIGGCEAAHHALLAGGGS